MGKKAGSAPPMGGSPGGFPTIPQPLTAMSRPGLGSPTASGSAPSYGAPSGGGPSPQGQAMAATHANPNSNATAAHANALRRGGPSVNPALGDGSMP